MKALWLIAVAFTLTAAPSVELFQYWLPEAKGEEQFPPNENGPEEELSLLSRIRKNLAERGVAIRSWEIAKYRKHLLSWSCVKDWSDFWAWLFPKKIELKETKWVFWSLGPYVQEFDFSRLPKEQLVLLLYEPPTVEEKGYEPAFQSQFGKVLTWDDDLVDGKKFFKFHYPNLQPISVEIVPFEEKKFCVMVATRLMSKYPRELYKEREKVIRFFEDKPPGLFDLYGRNWEKMRFKNWRGFILNKLEVIKRYKFSICYENTRDIKGYITEKIFDCFAAGVVPVYLGASNVTDYIPADCFIDRRRFKGEEELCQFLQQMAKEEYEGYLSRAAAFIVSERAQRFSAKEFVKTFLKAVY